MIDVIPRSEGKALCIQLSELLNCIPVQDVLENIPLEDIIMYYDDMGRIEELKDRVYDLTGDD